MVHDQAHIAKLQHLAVVHRLVGRHHLGAQRGLVGPALHQTAPQIALGALDFFAGARQSVNRQLRPVVRRKRVVAQPVVAVVVAVKHRNHRQRRDPADHADGHLANLQRAARVNYHHASRRHHKQHVGHHSLVLRSRKTILRKHHPDMGRELARRNVPHRRAFNKVTQLLRPAGLPHQRGHA